MNNKTEIVVVDNPMKKKKEVMVVFDKERVYWTPKNDEILVMVLLLKRADIGSYYSMLEVLRSDTEEEQSGEIGANGLYG